MSELKDEIRRVLDLRDPPQDWLERIYLRESHRRRNRRVLAGVAGMGLTLVLVVALMAGLQTRDQTRPGGKVTTPACGSGTTVAPTGWWRGDGSPVNAAGGADAVLHGGVAFGPGIVGEAFVLDGTSGWLEVPDAAFDVGARDFTVAMWVRFRSTVGEQVFAEDWIQGGPPGSEGWTLTKLRNDAIRFDLGAAGGVDTDQLDLPVGTWIHVAARRDAGTIAILVNGELEASGSMAEPLASTDSPASLNFGHRGTSEDTPGSLDDRDFFVRGELDEIEFFVGDALTDAQILDIFGTQASCAV